jgi:hypothetical protein
MKRFSLLSAAAAALTLCACSQATSATDGGNDSGIFAPIITVSGTASLYPPAAGWLADAGLMPPAIDGLTVRVIEPYKVAFGDSTGVFGQQVLAAGDSFSIPNVETSQVVLGVATDLHDWGAGVCDSGVPMEDAGCTRPRVMPVATAIYDVRLAGTPPQADITQAASYALPTAFHDQLTAAVTPELISNITDGGNVQTTLIGAGFILGQVVDSSGQPVPGVAVNPSSNASQFFYPSDDFQSVNQTGTGSQGLFLYVHNATQVATFTFTIANHPEYLERNGGASAGAGLIEIVFPGKTAP